MKKEVSTRDVSARHETAVAKALGGRRTPNSGATSFAKGDVMAGGVMIECKTKMTDCSSFAILKAWLDTLEEERIGTGAAAAALAFSFDCGEHSYYVVTERVMKKLVALIQEEQEARRE